MSGRAFPCGHGYDAEVFLHCPRCGVDLDGHTPSRFFSEPAAVQPAEEFLIVSPSSPWPTRPPYLSSPSQEEGAPKRPDPLEHRPGANHTWPRASFRPRCRELLLDVLPLLLVLALCVFAACLAPVKHPAKPQLGDPVPEATR